MVFFLLYINPFFFFPLHMIKWNVNNIFQADSITEKIGYPDYIMNDTALNADYEGVRYSKILECE